MRPLPSARVGALSSAEAYAFGCFSTDARPFPLWIGPRIGPLRESLQLLPSSLFGHGLATMTDEPAVELRSLARPSCRLLSKSTVGNASTCFTAPPYVRQYTGPMRVEVHLHAELARLAPDRHGVLTMELPEGARVSDLLDRLPLSPERRIIVGLNGESVRQEHELVDGARIDLLTPMAGGSARVERL
jgi:sulfur carrier protein ThiS